MEISVRWHPVIYLKDGSRDGYIYKVNRDIPDAPGIYVFARQHGESISPLYIGQAQSFARRIPQQLDRVSLMTGIKNASIGYRILMLGQIYPKSGQVLGKLLNIVEASLIEHCLSEGWELLNVQGTCTRVHEILHSGARDHKVMFPSRMTRADK